MNTQNKEKYKNLGTFMHLKGEYFNHKVIIDVLILSNLRNNSSKTL
jgi:hypothetical protein